MNKSLELEIITTGREYEEAIFRHLSDAGYNCVLTQASNDQGVDIIVKLGDIAIAIQCKLYSKPVGNDAVQEVVAGARFYNCTNACVVSNSTFTKSAIALASSSNVRLINHRRIFDYLEEFPTCSIPENFEKGSQFDEMIHRAKMGNEDARQKLGMYYYAQSLKYVTTDLDLALSYIDKAGCVGDKNAIEFVNYVALYKFGSNATNLSKAGFPASLCPLVQRFLKCELDPDGEIALSDEFAVEYDWWKTLRIWEKMKKEPKGSPLFGGAFMYHGRFADKHDGSSGRPNELFYLGLCYLNKIGGVTFVQSDKGWKFVEKAADQGYEPALKLLEDRER